MQTSTAQVIPNSEVLQRELGTTTKYDIVNRKDACKVLLALTEKVAMRLERQAVQLLLYPFP